MTWDDIKPEPLQEKPGHETTEELTPTELEGLNPRPKPPAAPHD